ncbi:15695_t:CDS:2, partial [Funneliformis geosporum]
YFADKEQPNEKNTQIKEKLLRNLDKICIEQTGHLANAELLKNDEENEYFFLEIEGEEINLEELSSEDGVEALINGLPLPVKNQKPTDAELAKLKTIFQKLNIKKISFKNGELVITHNNNEIITNNQLTNNSEYQPLKNYCQKYHEKEITKEQLGIDSDTNSTNSKPDNHKLVIGLVAGIVGG